MTQDRSGQRVAVVGGGVSGLVTAYRLDQLGYKVELLERDSVLGGRTGVGMLGDRPVMLGGKNIGRRYTVLREFVAAYGGATWEPFGINASRVKDGKVITIDSTRRRDTVRTLQQLGSPKDLARLALIAARTRATDGNRFLSSPYFASLSRRNDHLPLSGHFGTELTESFLRPLTVRMNGAEPGEVYLGTLGTNLGTMMDTFDQLRDGIQPVLAQFAARVPVRLGVEVEGVTIRDGAVAGLRTATPDGTLEEPYDGVVLATPAYVTAQLLATDATGIADPLRQLRYFPATVVLVEYDRPVFTHEVRALAMDTGPCSNAGSYGAEDRHIVRYTFSGRHARGPVTDQRIADWVDEAEADLARHSPVAGANRVATLSRHWSASYCGYAPFHPELLSRIRAGVAGVHGLQLAGDYLRGVSLEACSRSGAEAAAALADEL